MASRCRARCSISVSIFFHNAKTLLAKGTGPYFYLPKMEHYLEARLWNDVFVFAQDYVGVPQGTIRATVLIETILGAFQMDEILWELRDHSAGLELRPLGLHFQLHQEVRLDGADFLMPNRALVTMDRHFLSSYVQLLIKTCHRRNIHAMGGMAAQIPIKNDPAANEAALDKVRQDKLREVKAGHDGTWVAHPGLVPVAKAVFDEYMKTPNQIFVKRDDVQITAKDLVEVPSGEITEAGLRLNINVGLAISGILAAGQWLRADLQPYGRCGDGRDFARAGLAVGAASGEASGRAHDHEGTGFGDDDRKSCEKLKAMLGAERFDSGKFDLAAQLYEKMMTTPQFDEFLTLKAYEYV